MHFPNTLKWEKRSLSIMVWNPDNIILNQDNQMTGERYKLSTIILSRLWTSNFSDSRKKRSSKFLNLGVIYKTWSWYWDEKTKKINEKNNNFKAIEKLLSKVFVGALAPFASVSASKEWCLSQNVFEAANKRHVKTYWSIPKLKRLIL